MKRKLVMMCLMLTLCSFVACGSAENTGSANTEISETKENTGSGKTETDGKGGASKEETEQVITTETVAEATPEPTATPEVHYAYTVKAYNCKSKSDRKLVSETEYDSQGNKTKEKVYSGKIISYEREYHPNGQLALEAYYDESGNFKRSKTYDERGNETSSTEYNGGGYLSTLKHEYNEYDYLTKSVRIMDDGTQGAWRELIYDGKNLLSDTTYDSEGNVTEREYTEYEYDGDKLVKETYYDIDDAVRWWYIYEYYDGNVVKMTCYNKDGELASTYETTYDASNNILKKIEYGSDGTLRQKDEYTYDAGGNVLLHTKYAKGYSADEYTETYNGETITKLVYMNDKLEQGYKSEIDDAGIIRKYTEYWEGGDVKKEFTYDEQGRIISEIHNKVRTSILDYRLEYKYVHDERVQEIRYDKNNELTNWKEYDINVYDEDARERLTIYNVDGSFESGWMLEYNDAGKIVKAMEYDSGAYAEGRGCTNSYEYEYDTNGNLICVKGAYNGTYDSRTEYKYNTQGKLLEKKVIQLRDGGEYIQEIEHQEYDAEGNKIPIMENVSYNPDGTIYKGHVYEYDSEGNLSRYSWYIKGNLYECYEYEYTKIPVAG